MSKLKWASPVMIVPKKNGKLRLCVNYIPLNSIKENNNYLLLLITEMIFFFAGARYFININLYSGYHQFPLHLSYIAKTAFVVNEEEFQFRRMPFGLTGAPRTFERDEKWIVLRCVVQERNCLFGRHYRKIHYF